MRRRDFIAGLGGMTLASSRDGAAQTAQRVYRVGLLSTLAPIADDSEEGAAFVTAMRKAGYEIGRNLVIERRGAMGQVDRLPGLVQELIAAKVDVLVIRGFPTALAAKASGHPTVAAAGTGDAVLTGLVESFARPGGNITGISEASAELSTKRLGLLKEMLPDLSRVAMLWNQDDLGMTLRYRASSEAAEKLGIKVQALGVRAPNDFEGAFAAMEAERPDAILMVADSLTNLNRKRVIDYAQQRRLPAIYELAFIVRDGGLMSYGPSQAEVFERAAALTDRILKGTKPADLPFELPTRYVFTFNVKAAKAIGLDPPAMLLARADEVIE
jgi:putative tryptophan/tyrosine transport system substrate-binding protein